MKVYVIYDPLEEKVICVHQYSNTKCPKCKPIRLERAKSKTPYFLEEFEREVYNDAKTYDAPAILGQYSEEEYEKIITDETKREQDMCKADEEDQEPEIQYYNPTTKKTQKLFDTKTLIPVWNVVYRNHDVGWKGEAVYITLEADNEELAKDLAMANQEFTKHIQMKYFKRKCLHASEAIGNYVIGKVDYYEGDERL